MFCPKCGTELHNAAKFCSSCGTPIKTPAVNITPPIDQTNRQAEWSSKWNLPQQTKKQTNSKGYLSKWVVPIVALVAVIVVCVSFLIIALTTQHQAELAASNYIDEKYCPTFRNDGYSTEKISKNQYIITFDVNKHYDLWRLYGMITVRASKVNKEWVVEGVEETMQYDFEKNDNWYHISPGGNEECLIKMTGFDRDKVTLEYYSYRMGSYGGANDYDHGTTSCALKLDAKNLCFTFSFMGDWRIYHNYIGYNSFEVGGHYEYYQSSNKFRVLEPVTPDDYWWYERAKRQTGDYDADSVGDTSKATIGDVISFGKFEMDNDKSNGADSISWIVLDENDDGILVISKYCLACQEPGNEYNTWESSITRYWLNNTFYTEAFTNDEKTKIKKVVISNADNPDTGTKGGNDTADYLFLLSIEETDKYFSSPKDRVAYGTLYAQKSVNEGEGAFNWWLRTPGKLYKNWSGEAIYESYVTDEGYINTKGMSTDVYNCGIRPAMWISK